MFNKHTFAHESIVPQREPALQVFSLFGRSHDWNARYAQSRENHHTENMLCYTSLL